MRKGLGKNKGKGYYNIVPMDSHIHSLSAKGVKTHTFMVKSKKINNPEWIKDTLEYKIGSEEGGLHKGRGLVDVEQLNAKSCVCEKFRKGGKDVACAVCGKGMGINEKPMSKAEFKKFMKSLNAKGKWKNLSDDEIINQFRKYPSFRKLENELTKSGFKKSDIVGVLKTYFNKEYFKKMSLNASSKDMNKLQPLLYDAIDSVDKVDAKLDEKDEDYYKIAEEVHDARKHLTKAEKESWRKERELAGKENRDEFEEEIRKMGYNPSEVEDILNEPYDMDAKGSGWKKTFEGWESPAWANIRFENKKTKQEIVLGNENGTLQERGSWSAGLYEKDGDFITEIAEAKSKTELLKKVDEWIKWNSKKTLGAKGYRMVSDYKGLKIGDKVKFYDRKGVITSKPKYVSGGSWGGFVAKIKWKDGEESEWNLGKNGLKFYGTLPPLPKITGKTKTVYGIVVYDKFRGEKQLAGHHIFSSQKEAESFAKAKSKDFMSASDYKNYKVKKFKVGVDEFQPVLGDWVLDRGQVHFARSMWQGD